MIILFYVCYIATLLERLCPQSLHNVSASFFCSVVADETCRYELIRVEHKLRYVDESIHPKLICCGLLALHIDLSLGALVTLVPLAFDSSHFLGYRFLWLGCR